MQTQPLRIPALFRPGQLTPPTSPQVGGGSPYGAQTGLAAAGLPAAPGNPRSALVAALTGGGKPDVASLIPLLQQLNQAKAPAQKAPGRPHRQGTSPGAPSGAQAPVTESAYTGKAGKVRFAGGADRAGVHTNKRVVQFVGRIAGVYGRALTIGTGTNHNEFVKGTHRESDHWTGHAADIPASGKALTRLGQSALIAAGADPKWARKQKGGVFNIGGHQIIFNSNVGGNHFNHLHVSAK